jgi:hypothetical protein
MRRATNRIALVLWALLIALGSFPGISLAQEATPAAQEASFPTEFCTEAEILEGEFSIEESPFGAALVIPASAPDMHLYVLKVTLPPDSCVGFTGHYLHDGAVVWLVDEGTVEFDFQPIVGLSVPELSLHRATGAPEAVTSTMMLSVGDWVTADRAVNYSYRNTDDKDEAVIIMTVLENRLVVGEGEVTPPGMIAMRCKSVCRRR